MLVFFPLAMRADALLPSTELACIGPRFGGRSPVVAVASVAPDSRPHEWSVENARAQHGADHCVARHHHSLTKELFKNSKQ